MNDLISQILNLSSNKLKSLPFTMFKLKKTLKELHLDGNQLDFPFNQYQKPPQTEKLLQLLHDSANGFEKWPKLKLVTLGHGGVGKVLIYELKTKCFRQLFSNLSL